MGEKMPNLKLGDIVPVFSADSTEGPMKFHSWLGGSWAILFSHPADYTPVCTTELGRVQKIVPEFQKRGFKLAALSCAIIADVDRSIATTYGMMDPDEKDAKGMPLTCRAVFVIGPDKRLKLSILYPATTGRNFDEILRVIDSLQLTAEKK